MSLKAWLVAQWLRWTSGPVRAKPSQTPQRVQTLQQLYRLQPVLYQRYTSTRGQGRLLEVPWRTIDEYTSALSEAGQSVRDERPITPDWYPRETVQVSLDRFLTSKDGYYLDPPVAVQKFKTMATQLCEAMESSDEVHYGLPEHNLRMLSRMLVNLHSLTIQLSEAAAEE